MTIEQHPVPQDVTGFEFKLIGDMTIRQFAYLAGGIIGAYLLIKAPILPIFIQWPLAGILGGGGILLAFVPYQGRPLDRWLLAFVTSIYRPTQYVWKKSASAPAVLGQLNTPIVQRTPVKQPITTRQQNNAAQYLHTLPRQNKEKTPTTTKHEDAFLQRIADFFAADQKTPSAQNKPSIPAQYQQANIAGQKIELPPSNAPQKQAPAKTSPNVDIEWKTQQLNQRISSLQKELSSQTVTRERFLELQKELTGLLQEKEQLLQELVSLRKELEEKKRSARITPHEYATDTTPQQSTVKIVPEQLAKKKGLPQLTGLPNVVTGIVKTAEGDLLPNILVTVKDKEEMPVRALKTNKLGQFAASAPLANGTYALEIEDSQKRYQFDDIEITLSGSILPALELWAKGKKELTRAMLHNELFGKSEL